MKQAFYRAIRKYGEDSFVWEIIDHADSKEELNQKEEYWIRELNTCTLDCNSHGYNMTYGGEGFGTGKDNPMFGKRGAETNFYGKTHTEEVKQRFSKLQKERFANKENHPFYGKSHSDEAKEKMSKTKSEIFIGEGNPFYGKYHSDESKKKISEAKKGKSNKQEKIVIQLSVDGNFIKEFTSAKNVSIELGYNSSAPITACCRGELFSAHGYLWIYKEDYNDMNVQNKVKYNKSKSTKPIVKLNKDGSFVDRYDSIKEGGEISNVFPQNITACCKGKQKTAGGYRWMYEEDYNNL